MALHQIEEEIRRKTNERASIFHRIHNDKMSYEDQLHYEELMTDLEREIADLENQIEDLDYPD